MEYKKKLKIRLYVAIAYIVLGVAILVTGVLVKSNNEFVSPLGLMLFVIGVSRVKHHFYITKNDERARNKQIAEEDERNVMIILKAKNSAFTAYVILCGIAVIILSLLNLYELSGMIGYSVCILVAIYWICYLIYKRKY